MKSSQRAFGACVLIGVLALGACTTPQVRYDADARVNIANYHTYAWEPAANDTTAGGAAFKNPLNVKRLRAAVDINLAKHGLQSVAEGAAPDTYVVIAIGTRQNIETDYRSPVRFGMGWGYWRHPGFVGAVGWDDDSVYTYREGRISIDLFDAKKREAIWHASVEQDMTYLTGDKAEARINEVVEAMFAKFPGATPPAK